MVTSYAPLGLSFSNMIFFFQVNIFLMWSDLNISRHDTVTAGDKCWDMRDMCVLDKWELLLKIFQNISRSRKLFLECCCHSGPPSLFQSHNVLLKRKSLRSAFFQKLDLKIVYFLGAARSFSELTVDCSHRRLPPTLLILLESKL